MICISRLAACMLLFTVACALSRQLSCAAHQNTSEAHAGAATDQSSTPSPGDLRSATLHAGGATIDLKIAGRSPQLSDPQLIAWVQTAAAAISHYFGRFPLDKVSITVVFTGDGKVESGLTTLHGIRVKLGSDANADDLADDWVMTHEMFHLSFPTMDDQYVWLSEGRATYLEPLARVRQGTIDPTRFWTDYARDMPQGQPQADDRGLDYTHTWGRTYWGGAMFCLIADVRIREQTHNAKSLDDAMRAVLTQGGNHFAEWSMEKFIAVGDAATGTHVLRDLHQEMGEHPVTVDLPALWASLGVVYRNDHVTFDDTAPLAAIRRSITQW